MTEKETGAGIRTHKAKWPAIHGSILMYDSAISDWRPITCEPEDRTFLIWDAAENQWTCANFDDEVGP